MYSKSMRTHSSKLLIAFRPRTEWSRRYWFREPILLPRGTRIRVSADPEGTLPTSLSLAINVLAGQ